MYSPNHPGITPTSLSSFVLDRTKLCGYFRKSDLRELVSNGPGVAGIRFYNIGFGGPDAKMCAVAIDMNGFEMENLYLLSRPSSENEHNRSITKITQRKIAVLVVESNNPRTRRYEGFASVFSTGMINDLTSAGGHIGLGFFEVKIDLDGLGVERETHIAVPIGLGQEGEIKVDDSSRAAASSTRISDLPCPGKCANVVSPPSDGSGMARDEPMMRFDETADNLAFESKDDNGMVMARHPYLIPWG